jgi:hypothetical protein
MKNALDIDATMLSLMIAAVLQPVRLLPMLVLAHVVWAYHEDLLTSLQGHTRSHLAKDCRNQHSSTMMQALVEWLDLPQPDEMTWDKVLKRKANRGHNTHSLVPTCNGASLDMLPETKALLESFYAPWNAMLATQLGPEFTWEYPHHAAS